ncbi:MAG: hypothetical protein HY899_11110 [Deltaproteobacteria bacterium]|nr:hypothetical protein [Deltaproteobacteria bacterium]
MKRSGFKVVILCLALGIAGGMTETAEALNLTGNWQGSWVCTAFEGAKSVESNKASTLAITQVGTAVYARMDDGDFTYNGTAIASTLRPDELGEVALIECDTDNLPAAGAEGEMIRAKVRVKIDGSVAVLKATSIVEGPGALPLVGSCRYVYRRTDQTDPNLTACP